MPGLLKPLFFYPARHLYGLAFNGDYRKYSMLESRLGGVPRFKECCVKVGGRELCLPDSLSFLSMYREIFVQKIYSFSCKSQSPYIVDLGANIGLGVLFFKSIYPRSEIVAVEADPKIFGYLTGNVRGNGFHDVTLINKAAWCDNTTLLFNAEGADGGRVACGEGPGLVRVEAVDVAEFLKGRHVDFLKMDIEGSEEHVLPACQRYLPSVDRLFVEYHSPAGRKQCLHEIISLLAGAGFRIHIQSVMENQSPFAGLEAQNGYDMQLNIFCWR